MGLSLLTGSASATTAQADKGRGNQGQTSSTKDCDGTHHSKTGHGANTSGAYDNTCDGSPSLNGGGGGDAGGKPCAGCVGNADDKNPPGQYPDGPTDHNNGYECDQKGRSENEGNNGVGFGNPAHTGCTPQDTSGEQPEPSACPAEGTAAMTAHSYVVDGKTVSDLTGKVDVGDHVVANFTVAADCAVLPVTLVSYKGAGATRTVFDTDGGTFADGPHDLNVDIPACAFEVEFLVGGVVIDTDHGMNPSCDEPVIPQTPAPKADVEAAALSASPAVPATPAVPAVAASADAAPEVLAAAEAVPAAPAVPGHPTEVLGVQIERGAPSAGLARTGLTLLPLVALGTALCLVGMAMSSGRRRGQQEFVAIADRLSGF
ncbi:MAG TPA: hypothetical protein VM143_07215 [Acidimicrobiales bacterium]|nr:hypothetical protein [Acidimicrobiales bacterium]